MQRVLDALPGGVRPNGVGFKGRCPAHEDRDPSLSISEAEDGRVLLKCHAACSQASVLGALEALGIRPRDLFPETDLRPEPPRTLTVAALARAKGLPEADLRTTWGLRDLPRGAVAIPYRDERGQVVKVKERPGPRGERFAWPGGPLLPYGLERLPAARTRGVLVVTEGESDCWTLWHHDVPALGLPGAATAGKLEPAHVEGVKRILLAQDADAAGAAFVARVVERLRGIGYGGEVRAVTMPAGVKDVNDLHRRDPAAFPAEWLERVAASQPATPPAGPVTDSAHPTDRGLGGNDFAFRTGADLAAAGPVAIPWRVRPYLADKAITELDGRIKGGKTTFTLALVQALLDGAPFLGEPTVQTPVVYLSEQPETSFRVQAEKAGLLGRPDFHFLLWADTRGRSWAEIVAAAVAYARRVGAAVLVVDTLSQWANLGGESENHAGAALEAIGPLQLAAGAGLAVLVLRHERKGGGEVGDSARGSSAFGGAVDIIVSLRRPEGAQRPTVRELHALSRFEETPATLTVELTEAGFRSLGVGVDVATMEARRALLEEAPEDEAQALDLDAILARRPGVSRSTAQRVVKALVADGLLGTIGKGRKGDARRYYRGRSDTGGSETLGMVSAQTSTPRWAETNA